MRHLRQDSFDRFCYCWRMAGRFRFLAKYPLGSAFVIGFVVILLILGWRRVTEPRYAGKGIREWIEQLPHDNSNGSASHEALDHFGVRAVPYLVEAMHSPSRTERWLANKTPGIFRGLAPDLWLKEASSHMAVWKLAELVEQEQARGSGHAQRLKREIWPAVLQLMRAQPERIPELSKLLQPMTPLIPEAEAELRNWWRTSPIVRTGTRQWGVREVALLLASTGNPALVDDFLPDLNPTNSTLLRAIAAAALGELNCREERVVSALRDALRPDSAMAGGSWDVQVIFASLHACALLGICPPEAKQWLERDFLSGFQWQTTAQMLAWLSNTNNEFAPTVLVSGLGSESPFNVRLETAKLLGRAGPKAKQFVPALERMREDAIPAISEAAAEALERIQDETTLAEREVGSSP